MGPALRAVCLEDADGQRSGDTAGLALQDDDAAVREGNRRVLEVRIREQRHPRRVARPHRHELEWVERTRAVHHLATAADDDGAARERGLPAVERRALGRQREERREARRRREVVEAPPLVAALVAARAHEHAAMLGDHRDRAAPAVAVAERHELSVRADPGDVVVTALEDDGPVREAGDDRGRNGRIEGPVEAVVVLHGPLELARGDAVALEDVRVRQPDDSPGGGIDDGQAGAGARAGAGSALRNREDCDVLQRGVTDGEEVAVPRPQGQLGP